MAGLGRELARKFVHIGFGACAFLLRYLTPLQAAAFAVAAIIFNIFVLHRITRRALLREGERQSGFSLGILVYPIVVLTVVLIFYQRLELAAAVWAILAFGDGFATVAGKVVRGPKLPWNANKSWSGFIAFVAWGTAMSALLIRWTQEGVFADAARAQFVGTSFRDAVGVSDVNFLVIACAVTCLAAAFAESLDSGIDDNILVPIVSGGLLWAATLVEPQRLLDYFEANAMTFAIGAGINLVLAVLAHLARSVTLSGAFWGWVLGTCLYGFGGWRGFLMLLLFFVLGTATTKLGYAKKARLGIAQEKGGRRGAKNAFANTLTGVVFAFLGAATAWPELFAVGLASAFATAACDTCSSEIGQAYGRHHYLITSFKPVKAGTDGAVSLEGTLGGLAGAAVLAAVGWAVGLLTPTGAGIVTFAGFFGATAESYLGATVEAIDMLDNELVNFANTLIGALVGAGLWALLA